MQLPVHGGPVLRHDLPADSHYGHRSLARRSCRLHTPCADTVSGWASDGRRQRRLLHRRRRRQYGARRFTERLPLYRSSEIAEQLVIENFFCSVECVRLRRKSAVVRYRRNGDVLPRIRMELLEPEHHVSDVLSEKLGEQLDDFSVLGCKFRREQRAELERFTLIGGKQCAEFGRIEIVIVVIK